MKLRREGALESAFDELQLAAYTPSGVHVFRHDLQTGVSSNGKITASTGKQIRFCGPKYERDWRKALDVVLGQMGESCRPLAVVPWASS